MRKINTLFRDSQDNSAFSQLTQRAQAHLTLQQFWQSAAPAIVVKVQVKSRPKPVIKAPRILSRHASNSLKQFAEDLLAKNKGDSPLATKLNALASKN